MEERITLPPKKNRKYWKSQQPTRRERLNKRKGRMGAGWGSSMKHHRRISPHIFSKDRWIVTVPSSDKQLPMAFLSENRAVQTATAIANKHSLSVEIDHQVLNDNGEWISAPDEGV